MDKIYIIEDDENIRNLLKIALEGFGYEAEGFETAEEGLERIKEEYRHLLFLTGCFREWMGLRQSARSARQMACRNFPLCF